MTSSEFIPCHDNGGDPLMLCPGCGFECTHLDRVEITTGAGQRITLVADGEDERTHVDVRYQLDKSVGFPEQRRHTITLVGTCEGCDTRYSFIFRQHKGGTFVGRRLQKFDDPTGSLALEIL